MMMQTLIISIFINTVFDTFMFSYFYGSATFSAYNNKLHLYLYVCNMAIIYV